MFSKTSSSAMRLGQSSWLIALVNATVRFTVPEFLPVAGGILPRTATGVHPAWAWSFHFINESLLFQQALLILYGLVALCLLVGLRTSLSCCVFWILTVSLHGSNALINNTGDHQLALMLLWGCVLPLGERGSLDTLMSPATASGSPSGDSLAMERHRQLSISLAESGYIIQIAMLYWLGASHKDIISWLVDADAVWYAFNIDFFAHPLAIYAQKVPALL